LIEIEIREFKKHDIRGGIVIDGLPNIGLVSPIFSSYLVGVLQLDQIACLDSDYFPPASMIFAGKPKFPARIYAGTNPKLAIFVAEFTPPPVLDRPLAKKIFSWAIEQKASMIITSVPLPVLEDDEVDDGAPVLGVGSTQRARELLAKAGIKRFDIGIVTGTPGVLLNEGRWANFDVIALIVKAHPTAPDHRACQQENKPAVEGRWSSALHVRYAGLASQRGPSGYRAVSNQRARHQLRLGKCTDSADFYSPEYQARRSPQLRKDNLRIRTGLPRRRRLQKSGRIHTLQAPTSASAANQNNCSHICNGWPPA